MELFVLPLSDGKCCTHCNDTEVIPMRMAFIASGRPMPTEALTSIVKKQQKARAIADVSLKNITKEVNHLSQNSENLLNSQIGIDIQFVNRILYFLLIEIESFWEHYLRKKKYRQILEQSNYQ